MIWKGCKLETWGDMMREGIDRCETPEEAAQFMAVYRAESPMADQNIGYLSGYYAVEEAERIRAWFRVEHPFFTGRPTAEQLLAAGERLGRLMAEGLTMEEAIRAVRVQGAIEGWALAGFPFDSGASK